MDDAATAHARWQAARLDELQRPDGWLTLVGLHWLDDGRHRVGSATELELCLSGVPAHWGDLDIAGNQARWTVRGGTAQVLATDIAGAPTLLRHDAISMFLIERDGRLALRVRDENAPTRTRFAGIDSFAFDPAWRIEASWKDSRARFVRDGQAFALLPQDAEAARVHFVIADATSGRETYGGGRFLFADIGQGSEDGRLVLDFNRAINPPCAFTSFAVCPLPPAENRLPFAIVAGEKTPAT